MPGKGEGIAFLLDSCRSLLRFSGPQGSRSTRVDPALIDHGRVGARCVAPGGLPRAFANATSTGQTESSFARTMRCRSGQVDGRSSPMRNPPRRLGCGHAEAQEVEPVLRREPEAARRAAVPGVVVPATAPENP